MTTVNVLGKNRDIYFGMPAIEYVHEKMPPDYFERLSKGEYSSKDIKITAYFVYAGLMGGAERKDESLELTFGDVYDLVEGIYVNGDEQSIIEKTANAYAESAVIKSALGKKKEEPKLTGKRSKKLPLEN